jgi:hypothetical protein
MGARCDMISMSLAGRSEAAVFLFATTTEHAQCVTVCTRRPRAVRQNCASCVWPRTQYSGQWADGAGLLRYSARKESTMPFQINPRDTLAFYEVHLYVADQKYWTCLELGPNRLKTNDLLEAVTALSEARKTYGDEARLQLVRWTAEVVAG